MPEVALIYHCNGGLSLSLVSVISHVLTKNHAIWHKTCDRQPHVLLIYNAVYKYYQNVSEQNVSLFKASSMTEGMLIWSNSIVIAKISDMLSYPHKN